MSKNDPAQVEFRQKRAQKISSAMLNKAWTQAKLADMAGHDVRTVRDLLHGKHVSNQVIVNVCQALGVEAEITDPTTEIEVSETWYGSYAREPYRNYEGAYFAYRRSFSSPEQFIRSIYEISWHEEDWIFNFEEHQSYDSGGNRKVDHSQKGEVYISQFTDLIHLVTVSAGAVRTVTLTKMRGAGSVMRGAVLTQADRGLFFQPSVSAIYLEKIAGFNADLHMPKVGPLQTDNNDYAEVRNEIERIERDVMFVATERPEQLDATTPIVPPKRRSR